MPAVDMGGSSPAWSWARATGDSASTACDDTRLLATRAYAATPAAHDNHGHGLRLATPRLLHPSPGPVTERWWAPAGSVVRDGSTGCVRWRTDGRWAAGTACVDDGAAGGIDAATESIYRSVFAALHDAGTPHLLRLWNYLPRINAIEDGLERYRHFNVGRKRAFASVGAGTAEGSPAACALGTDDGALTVHFLAGQQPARAVENPRQISAYRYPASYGPVSPGFSRAALVGIDDDRDALFVSGTASIVGHATLHAGDVRRQTIETLANLRAVVDAANRLAPRTPYRVEDLDATVYVRHVDDLAVVRAEIARTLGAGSHFSSTAAWLRADVCRSDLAVEIEAQSQVAACP